MQFARLREVFSRAPLVEPAADEAAAAVDLGATANGISLAATLGTTLGTTLAVNHAGAARRGGPVDQVRDELLAGIGLPLDHDDDVALLVVHVPQWQGERARLFRSAAVDLVGGTEIAAHARAFASGVLRSWQLGDELCDTGVLAVSELVANAAIHGRPPVRLRLRRTDRRPDHRRLRRGRPPAAAAPGRGDRRGRTRHRHRRLARRLLGLSAAGRGQVRVVRIRAGLVIRGRPRSG